MTPTPSRPPNSTPVAATSRRRFLAIGLGLFAPIVLIWVGAATLVARGLRFPPALPYSTNGAAERLMPPAQDSRELGRLLGMPAQEIVLRGGVSDQLRALIAPVGKARTAVILVYPNAIGPQSLAAYFRVINDAGYTALIIEYRNLLHDPKARGQWGWKERADVLDAEAALRARGTQSVAALGVSEGAAAVIFAGAHGAHLAAIISDSSYANLDALLKRIPPLDSLNPVFDRTVMWELGLMTGRAVLDLAPVRAASKLDGSPLMVINGSDDPLIPPDDAREIFAAASGPKELWIAPKAGHAAALATDPEQYAQRVKAFLAKYLGIPEETPRK
jgi:fermentation-respiration switch protein FrsA (DUF1100 family)